MIPSLAFPQAAGVQCEALGTGQQQCCQCAGACSAQLSCTAQHSTLTPASLPAFRRRVRPSGAAAAGVRCEGSGVQLGSCRACALHTCPTVWRLGRVTSCPTVWQRCSSWLAACGLPCWELARCTAPQQRTPVSRRLAAGGQPALPAAQLRLSDALSIPPLHCLALLPRRWSACTARCLSPTSTS